MSKYLWLVFCSVLVLICPTLGCQSKAKSGSKNEARQNKPAENPEKNGEIKVVVGGIKQSPLNATDLVSGKFTSLSPAETGIQFQNQLRPENMKKYLLNGAGVATGDFDNDGLVDIYAVSQDGPNRLFRQTEPWKFEDVTEAAGKLAGDDYQGTGAAFIDIDNDGLLDIYVCNINGPNLLYVNQGNGTFEENSKECGVDFEGATTMCSFADYDRDGDLDLYLVNNRVLSILEEMPGQQVKIRKVGDRDTVHPDFVDQYFLLDGRVQEAGQRDRLFSNDGNGKFTDVSDSAGIAGHDMGLSATWWDYDNDGWMDLYVANDLKSPDHLYRNLGNGKFKDVIKQAVGHTPWFSMGADTADINNDGKMDFLVADMSSTTHYKQKTTMGEMGNSSWFLTMGQPRQFMRNALYLNSGSDRFFEAANLTGLDSTDWSWSIKFGDFDSDARVDVFVTNGVGKNMNDSDAGTEYKRLMAENLPEQAQQQLLEMPPLKEENLIFRNKADLKFENLAEQWGVNHLGVSQGASVVDLDRDGDLDLLVNNMNEPLGVYRNDIVDGNNLLIQLRGSQSNRFGLNTRVVVNVGETKLTRFMNSACGFMSADDPTLHFGLGETGTADSIEVYWPGGICQRFENVAANQLVQITEGTAGQFNPQSIKSPDPWMSEEEYLNVKHRHRELEFDDFSVQPLLPNKLSQLGPGMAWADVNGDGLLDCFAGGAMSGIGRVYLRAKGGGFWVGQKFSEHRSFEDLGAVFFDLDSDGDQDLYIVSGSSERKKESEYLRDRVMINNGRGRFSAAPEGVVPNTRVSGSTVSAADFDRDGDIDLFVGTRLTPGQWPMPATSYLLENQEGKLVESSQTALKDIGLVTGATWSDVDQDGWVDLLVSTEWGPVKLLRNNQGRLEDQTEAAGFASEVGWWNSINGADIDNDGDIDFVAMNAGLNTKYHANEKHPAVLFANDFDGSGTLDLVEAEYEGDTCYPIRGRSCSSHAMPFLKDKFPSYHEFALADIGQIYSDDSLEKSKKFSANQLRSLIWINDGKGKFEARELPRLAQVTPGFGTALEDFDGDGNIDLCIAQNFMTPQPETGQMDGGMGLMLKGDGAGNFKPLMPGESGIQVSGQGVALAVVDLNKDRAPDLVMTVNDSDSKTWLNRSATRRTRIELNLKGKSGNEFGIGSLVSVRSKSGALQTRELTRGTGYLSQSGATLFVSSDPDDPVTEIHVRWPDGSNQIVDFEPAESLLIQQQ